MKRIIGLVCVFIVLVGCQKAPQETVERTPVPSETPVIQTLQKHEVNENGISFSYTGDYEPVIEDGIITIYITQMGQLPYIEISKTNEETISTHEENVSREYVMEPSSIFEYEVGNTTFLGTLVSYFETSKVVNELYLEKEKNGSYIQIKAYYLDENDENTFKMIEEIIENLSF